MSIRAHVAAPALAFAAVLAATAVWADGEFMQLDVSRSTTGGVASIQRGALTFGGVVTIPEDDPSAVLSATWGWPVPGGATLRLGTALGLSGPDLADAEAGARLVLERYTATDWGSVYGLVDLSTIDRSGFALAQATFADIGLTVELSHGASGEYVETTLAASRRLDNSPVSLRAGYRFDAREVFVGVSVNTF